MTPITTQTTTTSSTMNESKDDHLLIETAKQHVRTLHNLHIGGTENREVYWCSVASSLEALAGYAVALNQGKVSDKNETTTLVQAKKLLHAISGGAHLSVDDVKAIEERWPTLMIEEQDLGSNPYFMHKDSRDM